MFDSKTVQSAIDALADGDGTAALDILKALLTAAATGGAAAMPEAPAESTTAEAAEMPPEQKEFAAFARDLMTLSQTETVGAAAAWIKAIVDERSALAADRALLDASERRALVTELVVLRAETPATAWERDAAGNVPAGDARKPVKRLQDETIIDLRNRVAALRAARTGADAVTPPAGSPNADESKLSDFERKTAASMKDEAQRKRYIELRLSRLA